MEGAKVAVLARTSSEIHKAVREIAAEGGVARPYVVDILELDSVERAVVDIERELGPINLLVNNAASFLAIGPIWAVDPADWWRDVETNLRGTFNFCRAAVGGMMGRRRGRIINLTGGGTATSFPHGSGYAVSKAGVLRFTECLNDSLAGSGVLAFAMDPGLVRTAMTERQLTSAAGREYLPNIPKLFDQKIDVSPSLAAQLSVEIATGRFDAIAGRMLMAARGDLTLSEEAVGAIVQEDLRSLRVNGMPQERPRNV